MAIVEEGEYKGNKLIVLRRTPEDRYPFQFGLSKAKLVLEHIKDIQDWVKKEDPDWELPKAGAESES